MAYHKQLRGGVVLIEAVPKRSVYALEIMCALLIDISNSAAGKILRNQLREKAKLELEGADAVQVHM